MVTGASSGIGAAVATKLATLGFHVVAAGRSEQRLGVVVSRIMSGGGSAEPLLLDLASQESVRGASEVIRSTGRAVDILVNNAGVAVERGVTLDGFQIQFGVNHLGHFLLTDAIGGSLGSGARVITLSSEMHRRASGIDFARVTRPTRSPFGVAEYAVSKLANILFTRELARRRPEWRVSAVHPGLVDTRLFPALVRPLVRRTGLTPDQGADTVIWCATEGEPVSGGYYASRTQLEPSAPAQDDDLAQELWERSERWCGVGRPQADG
jgi:NAD(P)-dependent dehydrogenase (short-subunit alcohol dehydrogenase family)